MPAFPEFEYNFHGEKGLVNINPEHVGDVTGHAPDQHGCVVTIRTRAMRTYPVVTLTREQVVAKLCLQGPMEWVRYSPTETAPTTSDTELRRLVLELLQDPMLPGAEYHRGIGPRIKPLRDLLGLTDRVEWSRERDDDDSESLVFRHEGTALAAVWRSASAGTWVCCGRGGWATVGLQFVEAEAVGVTWVREILPGINDAGDSIVVPPVPPHLLHDPDLRRESTEDREDRADCEAVLEAIADGEGTVTLEELKADLEQPEGDEIVAGLRFFCDGGDGDVTEVKVLSAGASTCRYRCRIEGREWVEEVVPLDRMREWHKLVVPAPAWANG